MKMKKMKNHESTNHKKKQMAKLTIDIVSLEMQKVTTNHKDMLSQ